jgi:hypothetical protein
MWGLTFSYKCGILKISLFFEWRERIFKMMTKSYNLTRRVAFLFSTLVFLAFAVSPVMALKNVNVDGAIRFVPAPNDDIANASEITAIPYLNTVSPFEATPISGDPLIDPPSNICNLAPGLETVWYKYTPAANVLVHMDSFGSNYDTYIVLWTGAIGNLTELACNDDATYLSSFQSTLDYQMVGGTTYYILVAQQNGYLSDPKENYHKINPDTKDLRGEGKSHTFRLVPVVTRMFRSVAAHDGYVVESNETSGVGLLKNSTLPYLSVGDDEKKRQIRSILSFNTASLPDGAVVSYAVIKVKQNQISGGGNIFSKLGALRVDLSSPRFGLLLGLESADFNAVPSKVLAATFITTPFKGWFRANLRILALSYFNTTGYTQFRLQFGKDDNNNTVADYIRFYSGDAPLASRPILLLRYYIP